MTNYWILVAPKNHVLRSIEGKYAQSNHGKSHPLRRMNVGDGVIYYSPKIENGAETPYQRFTAIGCVVGEEIYQVNQDEKSAPYRRNVNYIYAAEANVKPLVGNLTFIKDKVRWGQVFKFGVLHISAEDFKLIATAMNAKIYRD